jgi:hypothetical protein
MMRIYHPFWLWEDFKAGFYDVETRYNEQQVNELAIKAKELLSNSRMFELTALKVIKEWKHSAEVNLTNPSRNRQAWIGQASCCYYWHIPEYITKIGWRLMTFDEQEEANSVADLVIKKWEEQFSGMGYAKKNI